MIVLTEEEFENIISDIVQRYGFDDQISNAMKYADKRLEELNKLNSREFYSQKEVDKIKEDYGDIINRASFKLNKEYLDNIERLEQLRKELIEIFQNHFEDDTYKIELLVNQAFSKFKDVKP